MAAAFLRASPAAEEGLEGADAGRSSMGETDRSGMRCGHSAGIGRRGFLGMCGAAAVAPIAGRVADPKGERVRIAVVFLSNNAEREIWPYPGFDCERRHREILAVLREGCPGIDFLPIVVSAAHEVERAIARKDDVDGYLVHTVTLNWGLTAALGQIARVGKPILIADDVLGGSGVFLVGYAGLRRHGLPVAGISTTHPADLVAVARLFADVRKPGATAATFARACEEAYARTFARGGEMTCAEDRVPIAEIGECVKRLRESRFVIVGAGEPGAVQEFLGAKGIHVGFAELGALCEEVDRDEAAAWGRRWMERAEKVVEPTAEWIERAGGVYLAMRRLMAKHGTDSITVNCLGGFASGRLPAYPCLGFMQILDDGGQGVCEAMPDDSVSTLMARILCGRAGYVSDPALDTSKGEIIYAHCMAFTKPFGPKGPSNPFRIRTLHNRDPRGCCAQSFLPAGFVTTSFRTNVAAKSLVLHQAKAVGNLDADRGCRTQLVGRVRGDIGKLFAEWDRFGWHRVTVYGDLREPLIEFGRALGLEIIEEA